MKKLAYICGMIFSILLMVILLITSIEALTYWTPGYYQKEYTKYDVARYVDMKTEDLSSVTMQMMSYLRGDRDELIDITATIGGQDGIPFFNEREAAHMADVRGLFVGALHIRLGCAIASILLLITMYLMLRGSKKKDSYLYARTLASSTLVGTLLFFIILIVLSIIIASDFSKYFIVFHHIFFNNDLWILNPATDRLINIVPEPFFSDTAMYIGIYYGICVLTVLIICTIVLHVAKARTSHVHKS